MFNQSSKGVQVIEDEELEESRISSIAAISSHNEKALKDKLLNALMGRNNKVGIEPFDFH